ncbi:hypothetical protein COO60DRAFT_140563 [Scenedesmus sp. NREL 46B-D3]|nr:hypothetical protein COO60DRAFT_140563 [Scenedesmus sp. NREL 46B-D3]
MKADGAAIIAASRGEGSAAAAATASRACSRGAAACIVSNTMCYWAGQQASRCGHGLSIAHIRTLIPGVTTTAGHRRSSPREPRRAVTVVQSELLHCHCVAVAVQSPHGSVLVLVLCICVMLINCIIALYMHDQDGAVGSSGCTGVSGKSGTAAHASQLNSGGLKWARVHCQSLAARWFAFVARASYSNF